MLFHLKDYVKMRNVTWILHCYPRRWRERYQEEMLALLEQHAITPKTALDLLLGALDARLNSIYRSKEGSMLQHIRDNRSLSIIYLFSVAVFLITMQFRLIIISTFTTSAFGFTLLPNLAYDSLPFIHLISLIALLGITGTTINKAVKERQWGTLIFAVVCLGITVWMFPQSLLLYHLDSFSFNLLRLQMLFYAILYTLLFGCGLFLTGVYGLKLLRKRQGWPLLFALLIFVLPPASFMLALNGNLRNSPAIMLLMFFCLLSAPFLPLSAFLLTLANGEVRRRGWQTARIVGSLLGLILLFILVLLLLWSIGQLMVNGGLSLLNPVITITLTLTITLAFALLALARSFLIQPEREREIEAVSAEASGTQS
jgi:hypothetical protein